MAVCAAFNTLSILPSPLSGSLLHELITDATGEQELFALVHAMKTWRCYSQRWRSGFHSGNDT